MDHILAVMQPSNRQRDNRDTGAGCNDLDRVLGGHRAERQGSGGPDLLPVRDDSKDQLFCSEVGEREFVVGRSGVLGADHHDRYLFVEGDQVQARLVHRQPEETHVQLVSIDARTGVIDLAQRNELQRRTRLTFTPDPGPFVRDDTGHEADAQGCRHPVMLPIRGFRLLAVGENLPMSKLDLLADPDYLAFWAARHLCTVTTARPDGSLHVTPMGIVLEATNQTAWGVTMGHSFKARNISAAGSTPVAVCQLAGPHWASLEGTAEILSDSETVRRAEALYASRYRQPKPNPDRVALRISLTQALGRAPESLT